MIYIYIGTHTDYTDTTIEAFIYYWQYMDTPLQPVPFIVTGTLPDIESNTIESIQRLNHGPNPIYLDIEQHILGPVDYNLPHFAERVTQVDIDGFEVTFRVKMRGDPRQILEHDRDTDATMLVQLQNHIVCR